jgi:site-specific DNA recombinase
MGLAMRIYGYIRVSTDDHQAKDGISLSAQRTHILAYAELARVRGDGFDLVEVIADEGASAKTLHRPGMARLLGLMRSGEAEGVVVAKLDRLTRSLGDWSWLISEFFGGERAKVRLFSVGEEVNTTKASGRMMLNMLMVIAQWEREVISERTADGLREKIRIGERCGKVRFGHDLDATGPINRKGNPARLADNGGEQEAIRLMRRLRAEGRSLRQIAGALKDLGIRTKEGREDWAPATINRILKRTG